MLKNTEENRKKLAQRIVAGWSHEALVVFAVEVLADDYKGSPDHFDEDAARHLVTSSSPTSE